MTAGACTPVPVRLYLFALHDSERLRLIRPTFCSQSGLLPRTFFWPQAQAECCAGAVLKFTMGGCTYTAPTITLNLVSCVFTTPHHQPASARIPKNRPVPSDSIESHLQSSPTSSSTRFARRHPRRYLSDAPQHLFHAFFHQPRTPWPGFCKSHA